MESQADSVLYYSGYKGEETPRAIIVSGREYPVEKIMWRKRVVDRDSGRMVEIWGCKVAGRKVEIRKDETGRSEILPPGILS